MDRKLSSGRGGASETTRRLFRWQYCLDEETVSFSGVPWSGCRHGPATQPLFRMWSFGYVLAGTGYLSMVPVARIVRGRMAGDGSVLRGYDAVGKRWILSVESVVIQTGSVCISHCTSRTSFVTSCKRNGRTAWEFQVTTQCIELTPDRNEEYARRYPSDIQARVNNLSNTYSHLAMAYQISKCGEQITMRTQTQSRSDLI